MIIKHIHHGGANIHRIRSLELRLSVFAHHVDVGRILAMVVVIGLALLIIGSLTFGVAVRTGIAPDFYQVIALSAQHSLVIHNGPSATCACIPPAHSTIASSLVGRAVNSRWTIAHPMGFVRWSGSGCRHADPQVIALSHRA